MNLKKILLVIITVCFVLTIFGLRPVTSQNYSDYPGTTIIEHKKKYGSFTDLITEVNDGNTDIFLQRIIMLLDYTYFFDDDNSHPEYITALNDKALPVINNLLDKEELKSNKRILLESLKLRIKKVSPCKNKDFNNTIRSYCEQQNDSITGLVQSPIVGGGTSTHRKGERLIDLFLNSLDYRKFNSNEEVLDAIRTSGLGYNGFMEYFTKYDPENINQQIEQLPTQDQELLRINPSFYLQQSLSAEELQTNPILNEKIRNWSQTRPVREVEF